MLAIRRKRKYQDAQTDKISIKKKIGHLSKIGVEIITFPTKGN